MLFDLGGTLVELQQRGHDVVAVNLPAADDSAGPGGIRTGCDRVGGRTQLILVAQSLAGFTAPMVCVRLLVDLLVLLNAMVPVPGQCAGRWWANTGHGPARAEQAAAGGRSLQDDPDQLYAQPQELARRLEIYGAEIHTGSHQTGAV